MKSVVESSKCGRTRGNFMMGALPYDGVAYDREGSVMRLR